MSGLCFYFEENDIDVWSGRAIDLDAWFTTAHIWGFDELAVINTTDRKMPTHREGLSEYRDWTSFLLKSAGEKIIVDVPGSHVMSLWNYDHALELANSVEYGLTGAVYTKNRKKIERARREAHVGNLYFNRKCTAALVGVHPFGGFNMSGTDSKAGGPDYLLLFLQAKSIAEYVGTKKRGRKKTLKKSKGKIRRRKRK